MTLGQKPAIAAGAIILFFFSGAAALVYEVLWMKELSLLFGNSAQAAAATLAAFFAGIAAGNAYWGRRSAEIARPLRAYGLLELGVAASAVFYFGVLRAYDSIYGALFGLFEGTPVSFMLIKFLLSFLLFFPSAFFMGGTLPIMTQFLVRQKETLGRRASALYAINTFGAASGAFAAGFILPQALGFKTSYLAAMAATLLVAAVALLLSRQEAATASQPVHGHGGETPRDRKEFAGLDALQSTAFSQQTMAALAGLSGFAALGLQVLWIRMFAQVLHNSVYTYAAILSIFLLALALCGAIAREAARRQLNPHWFTPLLLTASGLCVAASPILFHSLTGGGAYIGGDADFVGYMVRVVLIVAAVVGLPATILGVLLPYLFKVAETGTRGPGETVGTLVTINTLAAIIGSVAAGFLLLGWLGLWPSLQLMAALYLAAALWLVGERSPKTRIARAAPIVGVLALVTVLDTNRLPLVRIDPIEKKETLLKVWEGADGTVAVVRRDGYLRTKLNNWYTLGSTGDMTTQQVQTHLPMLLHKNPKRVFYLGLGTGITAGAALDYPVEKVVVAEIAPTVIRASREFFGEFTNGLYGDPRVSVLGEDGWNVLRGAKEDFDLIISDLFIPWKAGTGTLYTIEHYETSKQRLRPGGLYAQWVPLYQVTEEEFASIARSMLQVFPSVTLWRGNFWAERPVVALIGHRDATPLDVDAPLMRASQQALAEHRSGKGDTVPLIAHYAGSMKVKDPVFANAAVNTDNRPIIEYRAPVNHRLEKAGRAKWFVGEQMLGFMADRADSAALASDAYLSRLDPAWRDAVQAGYYFHAFKMLQKWEDEDAPVAEKAYRDLLQRTAIEIGRPASLRPSRSPG